MTEQQSIDAELIQCFHDFYRAYAQREEGVVAFSQERLSPAVTGCGTGRDERFTDRAAMIRIFREELRQQPDPFWIDFVWTEALLRASRGGKDAHRCPEGAQPGTRTARGGAHDRAVENTAGEGAVFVVMLPVPSATIQDDKFHTISGVL